MQRMIDCSAFKTKEEAYAAGTAQAKAALESSTGPIFLVDEMFDDEISTSHAMGWNSIAVSEMSSQRLTAMSTDPVGAEQAVEALQKLFAKCAMVTVGEDTLKLNFQ